MLRALGGSSQAQQIDDVLVLDTAEVEWQDPTEWQPATWQQWEDFMQKSRALQACLSYQKISKLNSWVVSQCRTFCNLSQFSEDSIMWAGDWALAMLSIEWDCSLLLNSSWRRLWTALSKDSRRRLLCCSYARTNGGILIQWMMFRITRKLMITSQSLVSFQTIARDKTCFATSSMCSKPLEGEQSWASESKQGRRMR